MEVLRPENRTLLNILNLLFSIRVGQSANASEWIRNSGITDALQFERFEPLNGTELAASAAESSACRSSSFFVG